MHRRRCMCGGAAVEESVPEAAGICTYMVVVENAPGEEVTCNCKQGGGGVVVDNEPAVVENAPAAAETCTCRQGGGGGVVEVRVRVVELCGGGAAVEGRSTHTCRRWLQIPKKGKPNTQEEAEENRPF
ncbi:unnamed protein product [Cuscuta epithymum]|uniref:Uncharacterized protein n=1 Tax=Cuscuta epithymum TaxID=186058 RepID=A0AAV0FXF5_9ASTE|nr:unnamed protein product [Cuscuta epithymum]